MITVAVAIPADCHYMFITNNKGKIMPCGDNAAYNDYCKNQFKDKFGNLTYFLCKLCEETSPDVLKKIQHPKASHNLYDWYEEHKELDKYYLY